jgi:hypothetical protein
MELNDLDPSVPVHLTKAGIIKNGELDRSWFEQSVQTSCRAIEFGKAQWEKELAEADDELMALLENAGD